jgi:hypothetical protein
MHGHVISELVRPAPGADHRKTAVAAGLICAALGLHGLAYASPPAYRAECGKLLAESPSSGLLVHAPAMASPRSFQFATPQALGGVSRVGVQAHRLRGLTWTLLQSPRQDGAERQPIALLVTLGPSSPHYGGLRGNRSLVNTAAAASAAGWTKPLGVRLSIRW